MTLPDGGLIEARIEWDDVENPDVYPFAIPSIRKTVEVDLSAPVTFFVGENGSGKSTLIEAIAICAGANPEGGTRNLRFKNHPTESSLHEALTLRWRTRQHWAFFLRAETFFDMASAYVAAEQDEPRDMVDIHEPSHGQQFLHAAATKLQPNGLHLMDEPEAALSVTGQLAMLRRISEIQAQRGQFVIATHSPILLAYPDAAIYEFSDEGIQRVAYDDTPAVRLTKNFLDGPDRFFRHLFD